MRPQQQNRRIRGRGNGNNGNNRRGPNPLTRTYESNGPDVKIRGTAQQIAEKYTALARDAQGAGDRVMAENYLQHAEHYFRIIAAAQAMLQSQQPVRDFREEEDDLDFLDAPAGMASQPQAVQQQHHHNQQQQSQLQSHQQPEAQQAAPVVDDGTGPQPVIEGIPAEVALNERQQRSEGQGRRSRERGNLRSGQRSAAPAREETAEEPAQGSAAPAPSAEAQTAPAETAEAAADASAQGEGEEKPVRRTRRPRVRKAAEAQPEETAS